MTTAIFIAIILITVLLRSDSAMNIRSRSLGNTSSYNDTSQMCSESFQDYQMLSCKPCLNQYSNSVFCPRKGCIFYPSQIGSKEFSNSCAGYCNETIITKLVDCSSAQISLIGVIISFVLLIICPISIFIGCIYLGTRSCRIRSKVGVWNSENIPFVHVSNVDYLDVPVIAQVQVISDSFAPSAGIAQPTNIESHHPIQSTASVPNTIAAQPISIATSW